MKTIPVRDLRNEYGRILKEVEENGESYTITNHGRVVAQIVPPPRETGSREGVPLADVVGLAGMLDPSQVESLKADLAAANWESEDPFERHEQQRSSSDATSALDQQADGV
ncbi:prevent-host-death family protein [Kineococcus radiotolerans]|uniref:Antitoxin n=1 Tax=Kineococcus radiotolerans TaxID=131568 RepID=A0A7W4XUR9_KINRA|nr:type II toxin-antitoxin system Phd/YefM family antitoxin [Kineococcus radiotolerans]MBB2899251.1 prevent-host-death family protein [Kineococcus radiotolerans]